MTSSMFRNLGLCCVATATLGFSAATSPQQPGEAELSGRGDIYYSGTSDEDLAKAVSRAFDQLQEFKSVSDDGESTVIARFDDTVISIECKATDKIDRLVVHALYACKRTVKADDPELLDLLNELNGKFNIAKFCVLPTNDHASIRIECVLPFTNYVSRQTLLAWFGYQEEAMDVAIALEKERLTEFVK